MQTPRKRLHRDKIVLAPSWEFKPTLGSTLSVCREQVWAAVGTLELSSMPVCLLIIKFYNQGLLNWLCFFSWSRKYSSGNQPVHCLIQYVSAQTALRTASSAKCHCLLFRKHILPFLIAKPFSGLNWIVDCMKLLPVIFLIHHFTLCFLHYHFRLRFLVHAASIQRVYVCICLLWLKKCFGQRNSFWILWRIRWAFVTKANIESQSKACSELCFNELLLPFAFPSTERQLHPYWRDHSVGRAAAAVWQVPALHEDLCGRAVHHGG